MNTKTWPILLPIEFDTASIPFDKRLLFFHTYFTNARTRMLIRIRPSSVDLTSN